MKEGWEYKKLGECFISINNGANIKQIKGAKGIPITRIETLSNDKFNRGRMGYADILDASPYSSYILNDGDILMSHINSMKYLGRAVQYLKKEDETIIHGMNLLRLVPTKDVLSSFLIYQFFTSFFRNQIVSISHQSVNQASFNTTNLKNLKLKVPPLSEQQSIVDYLDAAFAKIDAMKANAEKALNEAKALFQASLKEMLEPKEGWEEKKLETLTSKIGSGATPTGGRKVYINKGCNLIRSMNVQYNEFKYEDLAHITDEAAEQLKGVEIKENDVLFNITGASIARCCVVPTDVLPARVNQHVSILRLKQEVLPRFLSYILNSPKHQKELLKIGEAGSTRQALTKTDLENHVICYPNIDGQTKLLCTLDSLKSKVDRLQANYDKISQECDALKQAILRQVFE